MKAEKTREKLWEVAQTDECMCSSCKESRIILNELSQLERLATEYQLPETQRLLEIGRATERAFEQMSVSFDWYDNYDDNLYKCVGDVDSLLEWHKEREAKG